MSFILGLFVGCFIGIAAICLCRGAACGSCESYMPDPVEAEEISQ